MHVTKLSFKLTIFLNNFPLSPSQFSNFTIPNLSSWANRVSNQTNTQSQNPNQMEFNLIQIPNRSDYPPSRRHNSALRVTYHTVPILQMPSMDKFTSFVKALGVGNWLAEAVSVHLEHAFLSLYR
jgi:hypothetical protein